MSKVTVLQQAMAAAGLTATGLADLLRRADDVPSSEAQIGRVQAVIQPLMNMAFTEGRAMFSAAVASTKATKEDKPDPVVKVRASEGTQIYGALKLVPKFSVDNMGWKKAVEAARAALTEHGIKADGSRVLTDAQKVAKALEKAVAPLAAEIAVSDLPDEAKIKALSDAKAFAAREVADAGINATAKRLAKNGAEWCSKLVMAIERELLKGTVEAEVQQAAPEAEVKQAEPKQKRVKKAA